MKEEKIISDITNYINRFDRRLIDWYVGITNSATRRLFNEHNVDKQKDAWIFRTAETVDSARKIEKYFIDKGTKGGEGGGANDSLQIYAYKVTPVTLE